VSGNDASTVLAFGPNASLILLQAFMAVTVVVAMRLAASVDLRRQA